MCSSESDSSTSRNARDHLLFKEKLRVRTSPSLNCLNDCVSIFSLGVVVSGVLVSLAVAQCNRSGDYGMRELWSLGCKLPLEFTCGSAVLALYSPECWVIAVCSVWTGLKTLKQSCSEREWRDNEYTQHQVSLWRLMCVCIAYVNPPFMSTNWFPAVSLQRGWRWLLFLLEGVWCKRPPLAGYANFLFF